MFYEIDDDGNIKIKTILIGDSGVGKTNLINIIAGKNLTPMKSLHKRLIFYKAIEH